MNNVERNLAEKVVEMIEVSGWAYVAHVHTSEDEVFIDVDELDSEGGLLNTVRMLVTEYKD